MLRKTPIRTLIVNYQIKKLTHNSNIHVERMTLTHRLKKEQKLIAIREALMNDSASLAKFTQLLSAKMIDATKCKPTTKKSTMTTIYSKTVLF